MKVKPKLPFVSIVLIAYNEEKGIGFSLTSLLNQSYPKNKYEILVIDDWSKDKTAEIVNRFPVRLIQHKKNLGRAQARNTGLKHAKGEIYVSFDGDCIAEKNWLKELIKVYQKKRNVLGVGGKIILKQPKSLTDRFLQENGYGNPLPLSAIKNKNIFSKFLYYLISGLISNEQESPISEVGEIMGANSSFYIRDLNKIGGWDKNLDSKEDTDICIRLRKKFPLKSFYGNKNAKIIHDHNLTFFEVIKSNFFRSKDLVSLYKKQKKILPILPFSIIIFLSLILTLLFNLLFFPLVLIFLPQILYFWWPIKSLKKSNLSFLIFPYMQFLLELSGILGMIRGSLILKQNETLNKTKK